MTVKYDPLAGTHISQACETAVKMAKEASDEVVFSFNGIEMSAMPGDRPSSLAIRWNSLSDERRRAYEASPKYAAWQEQRRRELEANQRQLDSLIERMPRVSTLDDWMQWIKEFAEVADCSGVRVNLKEVAEFLESRGFIRNQHVSDDPGTKERLESDRVLMAQYIMGQAISCIEHGMPPHPVTGTFVEKYQAMKTNGATT